MLKHSEKSTKENNYTIFAIHKKNMGKGDKKTKKGKRFSGSYGNVRPRANENKVYIPKKKVALKEETTTAKPKVTKKTAAKKTTAKKEK